MAQVIDYPDAPQGEVLRYDFAFYNKDYGAVHISERTGPASMDSMELIHSDRLLFCFTYWARVIHNLGDHNAATQLIESVKQSANELMDAREHDDGTFTGFLSVFDESGMGKQLFIYETDVRVEEKPRKRWSATLTRQKGGALECQPKVSLFGNVVAMSISSTLVLLDRTMRLATPAWRDMLLVGLGAMIYLYETYDHSKAEFISIAPIAAWRAVQLATESLKEG